VPDVSCPEGQKRTPRGFRANSESVRPRICRGFQAPKRTPRSVRLEKHGVHPGSMLSAPPMPEDTASVPSEDLGALGIDVPNMEYGLGHPVGRRGMAPPRRDRVVLVAGAPALGGARPQLARRPSPSPVGAAAHGRARLHAAPRDVHDLGRPAPREGGRPRARARERRPAPDVRERQADGALHRAARGPRLPARPGPAQVRAAPDADAAAAPLERAVHRSIRGVEFLRHGGRVADGGLAPGASRLRRPG
jgi:hypothetical protein